MKQLLSSLNSLLRPYAGIVLLAFLFASCKKDDVQNSHKPAAGFMAFNLSPDQPSIGFSLSGIKQGNAPIGYTNYTGVYLQIIPGNREVKTFDYSTGSTIALTGGVFADSAFYSAFLVGVNGSYRNLVVNDHLDSLSKVAGKAWVRFVNAIPDSTSTPNITVEDNAETVINSNAAFGDVSAFTQVKAGDITTTVSNGSNISANRTINVEENKVYTILFVGQPAQADSTKAVQIKFIANGIIND
jgi:hypothetical protein